MLRKAGRRKEWGASDSWEPAGASGGVWVEAHMVKLASLFLF